MNYIFQIVTFVLFLSCSSKDQADIVLPDPSDSPDMGESVKPPQIDLNNWKVTLPIPRADGKPLEIKPPQILDYPNIPELQDYMFNSPDESALVFFTTPGATTTNSSYSRTELRELMEPGSGAVNWTFTQGGIMQGRLRVSRISGENGNLDRVIIMQIHGRLTDEQRDIIGKNDNNAPPVVKIYWDDGKINFRRKVLVDEHVNEVNVLKTTSWKDQSHWFSKDVGFEEFELKITAQENYLKVEMLGTDEFFEFSDIHTQRWGVFENYFKAGNYLVSTDDDAFAEVLYYELEVQH